MEGKELTWRLQRRRVIRLTVTTVVASVFLLLLLCALQKATAGQPELADTAQIDFLFRNHSQGLGIIAGSTFTYALSSDASGLDPALMQWDLSMLVTTQIYETLVNHQPGGTIVVPGLARSWSVSPDGLTWTFDLQPGVKFHDGTDLDAAAVAYNLERWWDPAHPHHDGDFPVFGWLFNGFRGDPGCRISAVGTVGTAQVQITLTEPDSRLPSFLAVPFFAIASPTAIQAGTLMTMPVGSGPFQFVEWVPDDHIRVAGNTMYWGDGPRLETLVFQPIPDMDTRFAALQSNSVQGASEFSASYVASAALDPNLQGLWKPANNTGYLGINRGRPPLGNPLVRQAIAHAIDKPSLIQEHYNEEADVGQVAEQLLPPAIWGRDPDLVDYAYDSVQARTLLAQAGYTNGFTTTLWQMPVSRAYFPRPGDIAASIQADLQAVGITSTLVTYDWGTYLQKVGNGEADLHMLGWMPDYGHPHNFLNDIVCDGYQAFGPRDDTLCDQLQSALTEHDFDTLVTIYQSASRHVHDTLPLVPIAHSREAVIVRSNVAGPVPAAVFAASFKDVYFAWLIYLPVVIRSPGQ